MVLIFPDKECNYDKHGDPHFAPNRSNQISSPWCFSLDFPDVSPISMNSASTYGVIPSYEYEWSFSRAVNTRTALLRIIRRKRWTPLSYHRENTCFSRLSNGVSCTHVST